MVVVESINSTSRVESLKYDISSEKRLYPIEVDKKYPGFGNIETDTSVQFATQPPSSVFAVASKFPASGSVQPKATASQEASSVFAEAS